MTSNGATLQELPEKIASASGQKLRTGLVAALWCSTVQVLVRMAIQPACFANHGGRTYQTDLEPNVGWMACVDSLAESSLKRRTRTKQVLALLAAIYNLHRKRREWSRQPEAGNRAGLELFDVVCFASSSR